MAESRSGQGKKSGGSRSKSGARSKSSSSGTARSRSSSSAPKSRAKSSSSGSGSTKRKQAAKKGGQARGRQQRAQSQAKKAAETAARPAEQATDVSAKTVDEFREMLRKNLIRPLDMVMLSRERIEEVLAETVQRGRMTADDAQDLATGLLQLGRKQTNDVLKDLEQLLGRGRDELDERTTGAASAAKAVPDVARRATSKARNRAAKAADPVIAQADRARRTVGVGPTFPVLGYDDLSAAQVQDRLTDLTPAELRKVRDYERRNANRKTVLKAIEDRLA